MTVSMPDIAERVVWRVTPAQAHAWAQCGGFFQAQYRSGTPFAPTYNSLLGTAVHELVASFDHADRHVQGNIDGLIDRNWRAGRFAARDDHRALGEARTLLVAYATLRRTETVEVLGSEVFCQTRPRTIGARQAIVLSGRVPLGPADTTERCSFGCRGPARKVGRRAA